MNSNTIAGEWKQLKGKIKEKWGDLTDDDLKVVEGQQDQLAGILEKRYGYARDAAKKCADEFYQSCKC